MKTFRFRGQLNRRGRKRRKMTQRKFTKALLSILTTPDLKFFQLKYSHN